MSMLKSRADELERRLNQTREVLRDRERSLEHFAADMGSLVSEVEKIEAENIQLKRQSEEMEKKHAKEMADLARQQTHCSR